ncbi:MAG: hypothetical protein R3286_13635 [Gammaproteobacteria bacterium]|nr:hypothetical protein [Gammaproteobacteria bacterium]
MDIYEKIGYLCLGVVAIGYVVAMVVGMIAILPFGIAGLVVLLGVGVLLVKVLKERFASAEDDYYSKNVKR